MTDTLTDALPSLGSIIPHTSPCLFEISVFAYVKYVTCPLLSEELVSPGTIVCAIASKFYTHRPELHSQLAELAQKLAFSVPARGYKSLEIVQAYLLLTLWGCGAVERYEYDKTWLLLGMAIRSVYLLSHYIHFLTPRFVGWPPTSICTARRQSAKILRKVVHVTRKYTIASVRGSCALRSTGVQVLRWANLIRYGKSGYLCLNAWMT